MADRVLYQVRPLEHIYDMSRPPLNMPFLAADWPCMNILLDNNRITKRWGYKAVVDLGDGNVQPDLRQRMTLRMPCYLLRQIYVSARRLVEKPFHIRQRREPMMELLKLTQLMLVQNLL